MTRLFLILLLLSACSTPQPPQPAQQPPSPVLPATILVSQPTTVPTFNNVSPPKGTVGVTLWGPVEKLPSLPTQATSANGVLSIVIDSASIPGDVAARSGLGSLVLGYSLAVPVHAAQYHFSYKLRVPRADHGPASVDQVVGYFNLRDTVNGASLWLGQIIYDSRCGKTGDALWDTGTNTPIVNVVAPNFSCSVFTEWRPVSFAIGAAEIANAADALRRRYPALKLSGNIADYVLTHANVNPEISVASGERARIDVGITQWQIGVTP